MRAVYQFGLCGGVLVMLNFGIVLVYTPALLVSTGLASSTTRRPPSDLTRLMR